MASRPVAWALAVAWVVRPALRAVERAWRRVERARELAARPWRVAAARLALALRCVAVRLRLADVERRLGLRLGGGRLGFGFSALLAVNPPFRGFWSGFCPGGVFLSKGPRRQCPPFPPRK